VKTNLQGMVRSKLSKLIAPLAAVALMGSLLAAPAAAGSSGSADAACSSAVLVLRSLHVVATPSKTKVKPGDKFTVNVTVTRPAHEDPVGQGLEFEPPASLPAEGVTVGLSVWVGERTYFWQVGMTDANGESVLKLKVPASAEAGKALASASARHWVKSDCPDILEDGYTNYLDFVTILPR
jgi:hypothetical protein